MLVLWPGSSLGKNVTAKHGGCMCGVRGDSFASNLAMCDLMRTSPSPSAEKGAAMRSCSTRLRLVQTVSVIPQMTLNSSP